MNALVVISMQPRVTIGVCVRNCDGFVGDAIDSIIRQDFPHDRIRVVFVDDGSDDKTLSVIEDYAQRMDMMVVIIHTSWKGLGNARNMVLANAEGDYILWVDGDMVLSPDFLTKLVRFMEENPKSAIVKGKQALLRGQNLVATLEGYSRAAGRMIEYQSQKGRLKALGTGGALYRSVALRNVGGFDKDLRGYNEDWDAELRLRKAGWSLHTADAAFNDYERRQLTWQSLWCRYWLRGFYTHFFLHKNKGVIKHYRMFPPAAFLAGLLNSFVLFKLTSQKVVFFLPVQSVFKMTAWYVGYIESHLRNYAPLNVSSDSLEIANLM